MNNIEKILTEIDSQSLSSIFEIQSGHDLDHVAFKNVIKTRSTHFFTDLHLKSGHCVILKHANSIQFFIDFMALYFTGVTAIPIDPTTSKKELDTLIGFSKASAVIDEEGIKLLPGESSDELERIALVLFTSGTTSSPKGVKISKQALLKKFEVLEQKIGASVVENSLCFVSTFFGHGLICNSLFPIFKGKKFFIAPKMTIDLAQDFSNIMETHKITFFSSVPSHWEILLEFGSLPSDNLLKRVNCASSPLSPDKIKRVLEWLGKKIPFYDVYGATEMLGWFADNLIEESNSNLAFTQFWDVETKINEAHELLLKSEYMFDGYWSKEFLEQKEFFNTGDLFVDHKIAGRTKNTINKSGVKVQIEDVIYDFMQSGMLKDAGAFPIEDNFTGQQIGLFVVLKENYNLQDIIEYCSENISLIKHPQEFLEVKKIPHNSRGKTSTIVLTTVYHELKSVEESVLKIFNQVFRSSYNTIDIDRKNVVNWDSMKHAELIIQLQRNLKIKFKAKDIGNADSLKVVTDQVKNLIATQKDIG